MKTAMLLVCAVCLVAVASFAQSDKPLPNPRVLDEEIVMTSQRLSGYDILIIKDFSTTEVLFERIDDKEKPKVEFLKPLIVKTLTASLKTEITKRKLFKSVLMNSQIEGKAVILEGNFAELDGGSRLLSFWVGFGAGEAHLKVKGRLIDAKTGKELATFEAQDSDFKGVSSERNLQSLFPHQAQNLGQNIGAFVAHLY